MSWLSEIFGRKQFAKLDGADFPPFDKGTVWLVGAGPGGPGLLTLLGHYALGQADVVIYDALVAPAILALANPKAEKIHAGKRGGRPSPKQADISLRIIEFAEQGKKVVRLKGGDPYMFGRGGEEAGALRAAGIPFRIVPGITAGIGGLSYAGIPATHRDTNHAVIFLTGHDESGTVPASVDWGAVATAAPVIVMYMAIKHLPAIAEKLIAGGRDPGDNLAIVSHAALPTQQVDQMQLRDAIGADTGLFVTPAIVVLGPVSDYRQILDWQKDQPRRHEFG